MKPRFVVTYNRTTPESAEDGDFSEYGWDGEQGYGSTDDLSTPEGRAAWEQAREDSAVYLDTDDGEDVVEEAVRLLRNEGATTFSCSCYDDEGWYSTDWHVVNYSTSEEEEMGYHPEGFTDEQLRAIHARVTKRGA